ncbi:MAG: hypothetical protein HQL31_10505 [Planctomycetes bacterium]|nr:hypothetical protein [Planctomycetota bacterium]
MKDILKRNTSISEDNLALIGKERDFPVNLQFQMDWEEELFRVNNFEFEMDTQADDIETDNGDQYGRINTLREAMIMDLIKEEGWPALNKALIAELVREMENLQILNLQLAD